MLLLRVPQLDNVGRIMGVFWSSGGIFGAIYFQQHFAMGVVSVCREKAFGVFIGGNVICV